MKAIGSITLEQVATALWDWYDATAWLIGHAIIVGYIVYQILH